MEKRVMTDDFSVVSKTLLSSPLNGRESLDVILYLIKRNIESVHILDEKVAVAKIPFEELSTKGLASIKDMLESNNIKALFDKDEELLSKKELAKKAKLKKMIHYFTKSDILVKSHKTIQTHLLNKENYEKEDINEVYHAFLDLDIDESLCDKLKCVLESNLSKRKKKEQKKLSTKIQSVDGNKKKIESKNYITDKEYKELKKEIGIYFDMYTCQPTRDLTKDEVLHCANLLLKIGAEQGIIRALFDRVGYVDYLVEDVEENTVITYLEMYDELKSYETKLNLYDEIKYLKDCFQELFLSNSEDYSFWKKDISKQLVYLINGKLKNEIGSNYHYAIEKASTYEEKNVLVKKGNTK